MPRRPAPRVPAYRHYRPKDLAVDGRDVYLGRHGSPESHEKYRRVVAEWLAGQGPPPARPTATTGGAVISISEMLLEQFTFDPADIRRT